MNKPNKVLILGSSAPRGTNPSSPLNSAGGPQDTEFLFDDFLKAVAEYKEGM